MYDRLMIKLVKHAFANHHKWLVNTIQMCDLIRQDRGSGYGFEWAIQTAIGQHLIANAGAHNLKCVRLNQPHPSRRRNGRRIRYDVFFRHTNKENVTSEVIVELKTVVNGDLGYTRRYGLNRWFPENSVVYFLIVSYPFKPQVQPDLGGTIPVLMGRIQNYPYFLYRKTGYIPPLPPAIVLPP